MTRTLPIYYIIHIAAVSQSNGRQIFIRSFVADINIYTCTSPASATMTCLLRAYSKSDSYCDAMRPPTVDCSTSGGRPSYWRHECRQASAGNLGIHRLARLTGFPRGQHGFIKQEIGDWQRPQIQAHLAYLWIWQASRTGWSISS